MFGAVASDYSVSFGANVTGARLAGERLLLGFDSGELGALNLATNEYKPILELPKISSATQDNLSSRITAIDEMDGAIAFIHDGDLASKKISIYQDGKLRSFDIERGAKKLYFIDKNQLLVVSLSSEIFYLNIISGDTVMASKLTSSSWIADSAYMPQDGVLVASSEGGVVIYFDVKNKKTLKELPIQKDILYSVAAHKERFIAGSAEKLAYYYDGSRAHIFKTDNTHVYKVALDEDMGAYYTDGGYIEIFDRLGVSIRRVPYDKEQIANMFFWGDFLITSGYDSKIYFWSVK